MASRTGSGGNGNLPLECIIGSYRNDTGTFGDPTLQEIEDADPIIDGTPTQRIKYWIVHTLTDTLCETLTILGHTFQQYDIFFNSTVVSGEDATFRIYVQLPEGIGKVTFYYNDGSYSAIEGTGTDWQTIEHEYSSIALQRITVLQSSKLTKFKINDKEIDLGVLDTSNLEVLELDGDLITAELSDLTNLSSIYLDGDLIKYLWSASDNPFIGNQAITQLELLNYRPADQLVNTDELLVALKNLAERVGVLPTTLTLKEFDEAGTSIADIQAAVPSNDVGATDAEKAHYWIARLLVNRGCEEVNISSANLEATFDLKNTWELDAVHKGDNIGIMTVSYPTDSKFAVFASGGVLLSNDGITFASSIVAATDEDGNSSVYIKSTANGKVYFMNDQLLGLGNNGAVVSDPNIAFYITSENETLIPYLTSINLPLTLLKIRLEGKASNELNGEISRMDLTYLLVTDAGRGINGDISNMDLTYLYITINENITGDISNMSSLTVLWLSSASDGIEGSISGKSLTAFNVEDAGAGIYGEFNINCDLSMLNASASTNGFTISSSAGNIFGTIAANAGIRISGTAKLNTADDYKRLFIMASEDSGSKWAAGVKTLNIDNTASDDLSPGYSPRDGGVGNEYDVLMALQDMTLEIPAAWRGEKFPEDFPSSK